MVKTQTELRRHGARVTPLVRRAKVELTAHGTRKTVVELERLRITAESEGRRSQ